MFLSEEKKKTDPRRKSKREEGSIERGKRGARPKGNRMRTPQLHKDKCAGRRPDKGRRPWCEQGSSSKRGSKRRAGHGGHGGHGGRGALRRSAAGAQVRQRQRRASRGDGKRVGALRTDWARKHAPTDAHAVISTIMPREDSTRGMVSAICCWIAVRAEWTHIFCGKSGAVDAVALGRRNACYDAEGMLAPFGRTVGRTL